MTTGIDQQRLKVLHVAGLDYPPIGVLQQMLWESEAAAEALIDWDSLVYSSAVHPGFESITVCKRPVDRASKPIKKLLQRATFSIGFYLWLLFESRRYDVVLLRYRPHDFLQLMYVRLTRCAVLTVHHTIEPAELSSSKSWVAKVRSWLDDMLGRATLARIAGIVSVTGEIDEFEASRLKDAGSLKRYLYPNGISYRSSPYPNRAKYNSPKMSAPELLFVASSFSPWHGLDKLMKSISRSNDEFVLHLVGDIPSGLSGLAIDDKRILMHGKMTSDEIQELSGRCCLGISSLAMERAGLTEACTLKVREYLANGLAVYAGYKEVFPADFPYYRRGSGNIQEVLEFAQSMRDEPKKAIRAAASEYIEKKNLVLRLYDDVSDAALLR